MLFFGPVTIGCGWPGCPLGSRSLSVVLRRGWHAAFAVWLHILSQRHVFRSLYAHFRFATASKLPVLPLNLRIGGSL